MNARDIVDHIYVLTTAHKEKDRLPPLLSDLMRIGLIKSVRDHRLSITYGTSPRLYEFILQHTPAKISSIVQSSHEPITPQYSATMNHYRIMQESLERGFERVMILEDDERFLKDTDYVIETIGNCPQDMDFLMLDWLPVFELNHYTSGDYIRHMKSHADEAVMPMHPYGVFGNCGCTIKSRKCLTAFQELIESAYYPIPKKWANEVKPVDRWQDQGVLGQYGLKSYMSVPQLCVQSISPLAQNPNVVNRLKIWYSKAYEGLDMALDFEQYTS